ncbi:MAG: metal-sensing transcriptional repressor [Aliarcobacter sp.]
MKKIVLVLQQISASRGAIQSLMSEVLDSLIKSIGNHVRNEQREEEIENLCFSSKTIY